MLFITNMSRKEGDDWNGFAGIEGLQEIRKYSAKAQVFFFIGNVKNT